MNLCEWMTEQNKEGWEKKKNLEQQKRGSCEEPSSPMYVMDVVHKREGDYDKTTMHT